jgi:hypothetical protein
MENARENPALAPEAIAARARSTYTRADIVETRPHCTTFWAVYTTPEGEVTDRIYCYSDMVTVARAVPGCNYRDKVAARETAAVKTHLAAKLGDKR